MSELPLVDSKAWQEEAQAVINDVKIGVQEIVVSEKMESHRSRIYLNVTTLEGDRMCVELSAKGFRTVARSYDSVSEPEEVYFETPYSLLGSMSGMFRQAFGNGLAEKLKKLQKDRKEYEDCDSSSSGLNN